MHQMTLITKPKSHRQTETKISRPGARNTENISEPLPEMIGFICYPVIPQAVTPGWSW